MTKPIDPMALFRLSVLGPLLHRPLNRGEFQRLVQELAERHYEIPGSRRTLLSAKTIAAWYYAYRDHGIDGLAPRPRRDRGLSQIAAEIQEQILVLKQENPRRSLRQIQSLLEASGHVAQGSVSRSAIHRLLQHHGLSRPEERAPEEKRSFVAAHAGDLWYGDVLHGPRISLHGKPRKVYLVSLMDDASRLLTHSAFCLGETALDIEGVLKQALLKRGVPRKLVVDNGAAYRSASLQGICVRLGIALIYCRPYAPEGKGKLERWHRTFRDQFLSELDLRAIRTLEDLNARLWAWLEQVYHQRPHGGLAGLTPLQRYQQDLPHIRSLGIQAPRIDDLFYHRLPRKVRKDGTVSWEGRRFEVPYELAGKAVTLVVDPHAKRVLRVEKETGEDLGPATPLDLEANAQRRRHKPSPALDAPEKTGRSLVEIAHRQYYGNKEG
ncbi:MAG: DDE-type integrase/transposase/recombinase [Acidithiobacillus caldus]|nr:DDE-type integrase/transposase/recombinase [Acidithiobacillus caldus]